MTAYAEVVVNRPIIQRQVIETAPQTRLEWRQQADTRLKTFHYHIPPQLVPTLQAGHLVAVPFRKQQLQGVVVALSAESPVEKTRPISAILDPQPILTPQQIELARWLAREYLSPLATCLNFFLPPGGNRQPLTVVEGIPSLTLPEGLTPLERALHLYLLNQKEPTPLEDLEAPVVDGLVEKGLARKKATLSKPRVGPKIEQTIELLIEPDEFDDVLATLGRNSKQAVALNFLATSDDPLPPLEAVKQAADCGDSPINALVEKGFDDLIAAQTLISPTQKARQPESLNTLPPSQRQWLEKLLQAPGPAALTEDFSGDDKTALLERGLITEFTEPARLALRLPLTDVPQVIMEMRGTNRHAAVLNLLANEDGPLWIGWVYAQTEATKKHLQDLAKAKAIAFDNARKWRNPLGQQSFTLSQPPQLTPEQDEIIKAISPNIGKFGKPYLIHGVTGSGKTEIYLQLIAQVLAQGKGAIFLAPEIMLATQIVQRVQARFPDKVALWHSALSPGERFDMWERVRQGDLPIVVGPRSALFAPLHTPGLIVIDEEHEPAYKQQGHPPFHIREAAIEYARLLDIPLVMGSATPDVVSYRKAQRGEYHLLTLPTRILAHKRHLAVQENLAKRKLKLTPEAANTNLIALPLPPVEIVDLREELRAGNRTIFSGALKEAIEKTLKAGEQVILFLNRRGTATFVNCRDCGYVSQCPRCDTTLTFHAPNKLLACHYCGYHAPIPQSCPECHSKRIKYFGLGTERVEAMVKRTFPQARPIRLDQDTTRKRGSHFTFLQHFVEGRANVMIGTQMVAKGLDLPLVTLVGVISADTALYLPEFRAAERTFQVLMQVAGRAGRSPLGGKVILQTYTPDQPAIMAAAEHDYLGFYNDELRFRYEQGYPPFKRLARLTYTAHGKEKSYAHAQDMAERLRLWVDQQGFPAVDIIGPAPTYVERIRNKYRWQLVLRAPNPPQVLGPVPLPLGWKVDIDPVNLL